MKPDLLKISDVAEMLSVHRKTVEKLIRRGELDAVKMSPTMQGRVRVSRESVERYIARLELDQVPMNRSTP